MPTFFEHKNISRTDQVKQIGKRESEVESKMSEVKLNIVDAQQTMVGTIHGSMIDACVAALSAEPETFAELDAALARYVKPADHSHFISFRPQTEIDDTPWDAGVVVIDLQRRIVAAESSYSQPLPEGQVKYHDGTASTDVPVLYMVPPDWRFFNSLVECESFLHQRRVPVAPLDTRVVLYGCALLEFIATNIRTC